ncbi:MAG: hypothetical protein M1829_001258 [Trizodia sp. TS-e1964]|nr:MAG: hypothetical protein M1829_001258 [Trizodia sp. TS-e1964]
MKATPLIVTWHNENTPIYSAHFETHGKGRLATGGGDNNVRLWKLEAVGEDRRVTYLSTLTKHTQAVNVVRFSPRAEVLASAGDDGNVLLWVPSESQHITPAFGEDGAEDKETWRVKHMCRSSSGSEIYDLAWSPDGVFFITGSMDNIARIYNAHTGQMVRQIAEHNHYVQGVAWDPLNEFVATQSSDRSVHIYTLKSKDGQFTLAQHGKISKMDLPARRISSNSPAPPEMGLRASFSAEGSQLAVGSPLPSAPGTPTSLSLPMNPPAMSPSRRSSFESGPSMRRSASPAPSLPLPAVRPMESSPNMLHGLGVRNANIYANETFTSFFRRLAFTPDGSLLFTPAGQYKTLSLHSDPGKQAEDVINTVYIYTRAGFNKPPIAHLPGHKKPSIAVKCSPIIYTLRKPSANISTKQITVDTSSSDDSFASLPESAMSSRVMEPPPVNLSLPTPTSDPKADEASSSSNSGPTSGFSLPYRVVYAVATQDAVLIYDTQQQAPLCIVSNLHFATFTDLAWSNDGLTLLMSSSDGFCSCVTFTQGELGQQYQGAIPSAQHPHILNGTNSFSHPTPAPTPGSSIPSPLTIRHSSTPIVAPAPSLFHPQRTGSPTRSNSTSSLATQSSYMQSTTGVITSNPTPTMGSVPSLGATNSQPVTGIISFTTPPQTPHSAASSVSGTSVLGKRDVGAASESEKEEKSSSSSKRRRIAPTPVLSTDS